MSVGSFRLLRRLAIGGMGEVFLAIQNIEEEERQVALKRVLPHLVNERQFVDRFVDEARLMTRLLSLIEISTSSASDSSIFVPC